MSKFKIGIIGFGSFGTLVASILARDFEVFVYHYRKKKENDIKALKIGVELVDFEKIVQSDIVVLAVPIKNTKEMIKRVALKMKKGSILVDTCSVKIKPCAWLQKYSPKHIEIMGMHPMFGPVTTKFDLEKSYFELDNKQIVLCPLRIRDERLEMIKNYLHNLNLDVIETSPENHDEQNAKTLSLVHFLGRSLTQAGIGKQKIFTPGYQDVLKILPHTNNDKWQLFFDMNNFNPYSKKVRDDFLKACHNIENKIIKSDSSDDFDYQRKMIDKIDGKIFELFEERMKCSKKIGEIKKKKGLAIVDEKREMEIIEKRVFRTELSEDFVKRFYQLVFGESYKVQ